MDFILATSLVLVVAKEETLQGKVNTSDFEFASTKKNNYLQSPSSKALHLLGNVFLQTNGETLKVPI